MCSNPMLPRTGANLVLSMAVFLFVAQLIAAQEVSKRGREMDHTGRTVPVFTPVSTPITGVDYGGTAWGDYDNDGQLDILVTGLTAANQLSAKLYRNERGAFTEIQTVLPGAAQAAVAWGDYDNDGDLDLLLCGEGAGSKIYRNDRGTFVDIQAPLTYVSSAAVDWGDYDNDGDLDVLLAGRNIKGIAQIYRNDRGRFIDILAPLKGGSGGSANWGDYDDDEDLDILLTGFHDNGIFVSAIYNNDNGVFSEIDAGLPEVALSAGAWGDYDNDGDLDILLAGFTPALRYVATVFRNDSGRFVDIAAALDTLEDVAAAWGDCDNDGDLDILLSGYLNSTRVSKIFQNNGGAFVDIAAGLQGIDHGAVAWGDYDNDGDLDILLAGNADNDAASNPSVLLYRNDGTAPNTPPTPPSQLRSSVNNSIVTLVWRSAADGQTLSEGLTYNLRMGTRPGGNDIVSAMANAVNGDRSIPRAGNTNHNRNWVIKNLPLGQYYWSVQAVDHAFAGSAFAEEQTFTVTTSNSLPVAVNPIPDVSVTLNDEPLTRNLYTSPAIFTDPDGDSLFYIAQSLAPDTAEVTVTNGILTITPLAQGKATITLIARDSFNASSQISFTVSVLGETAGPFVDIAAWMPGTAGSSAWGDYDNDGDLDILLTGATSTEYQQFITKVFRNDNGFFVDASASLVGVHGGSVAWGDYDNDGDLDILLSGWTADAMRSDAPRATKIYRNDEGRFVDIAASLIGIGGGAVDWGDFDNDGDLDILMTGLSREFGAVTKIYRNDVGDNFIDLNAALDPVFRSTAVWGDYDNDGDLDVLLAGYSQTRPSPIAKIYRNEESNFIAISADLAGVGDCAAAWGDYDNDGDLDILLSGVGAELERKTKIYRNEGGSFSDIGVALAVVTEGSVAWGDYDNDGDLDVLLSRNGYIYRNDKGSFAEVPGVLPGTLVGDGNFGRGGSISWGDYDNDQDLDALVTEFCSVLIFRNPSFIAIPVACSKVYRNDAPKPNRVPTPPSGLVHTTSDSAVSFNWEQANDDETTSLGLTYNLRLGRTPGGDEIVSSMSEANTGYRKIHEAGNMGHSRQWKIARMPEGRYYWSVQAIDPAMGSSAFAPENSFAIQSESAVIEPLAFDFGEVNLGGRRDTVLTLISRRTGSLTISDVAISGADSLHFSFLGDTSFVLNGGEQRALPVRFQPRALGNKSARLIISHDGVDGFSFADLAGNGVDLEPPVIAAINAAIVIPLKTSLAVSAQISDNNVVQEVRLLYRQGGRAAFEFVGMSLDAASTYTGMLPDTVADIRGVEFDIEATDGINTPTRAGWCPVQVSLPEKFLSRAHLGGLSQNAYRLISIPLDSNDPLVASTLLDDLGPADTTLWRLWDIDPQRTFSLFPYREYPSTDNLAPGKAKFLITSEDKNLTSGSGQTVRTVLPFEVRLQPGWNMIASPFNFTIPLANVYPESLRTQLYVYDGAWTASPNLLKPWEGYLLKAMQEVTLSILPSEGIARSPLFVSKDAATFEWSIRIEATCERTRDFDNVVGVVKDAALEWDRYERFEPPPIGEYVMLAFPRQEWQRYADVYTTDIRPVATDGHVWDFTVMTSLSGKAVTLRFDNLSSLPPDLEVRLIDVGLKLVQDLSREAQYVFLANHVLGKKHFQLLVGKSDFIFEHSANIVAVPTAYELAQNFPNPFRSEATSIKFGLPQRSLVSLKIYNLLGKKIATLLDAEEKEAGYYAAIWNGRDHQGLPAPSGIYFCRMQIGNVVLLRKMTLIK